MVSVSEPLAQRYTRFCRDEHPVWEVFGRWLYDYLDHPDGMLVWTSALHAGLFLYPTKSLEKMLQTTTGCAVLVEAPSRMVGLWVKDRLDSMLDAALCSVWFDVACFTIISHLPWYMAPEERRRYCLRLVHMLPSLYCPFLDQNAGLAVLKEHGVPRTLWSWLMVKAQTGVGDCQRYAVALLATAVDVAFLRGHLTFQSLRDMLMRIRLNDSCFGDYLQDMNHLMGMYDKVEWPWRVEHVQLLARSLQKRAKEDGHWDDGVELWLEEMQTVVNRLQSIAQKAGCLDRLDQPFWLVDGV